ncbi:hypothetical protein ACHAP7_011053 [Fusarium lateritium]
MAPKAANKESASKDPATAPKAPEKKDAGKKTAASSDKTKHTKTHKETYSSYILYLSHFASTARSRTRGESVAVSPLYSLPIYNSCASCPELRVS